MSGKTAGLVHFGGGSTRARVDPQRRVGLANAVAAGLDLSSVGVLSERELAAIRRLADEEVVRERAASARAAREDARRATSAAKQAGWPDTLEARRANFLKEQETISREAAERKKALDDLYAAQLETQRLASIARVELKNRHEDARGRNVKSMRMLHEAIKGREEQIAFKNAVNDDERDAAREEVVELQRKLWGDAAEAAQLKLVARERNMEEKLANMNRVSQQIAERRKQREEKKKEYQDVQKEAAEEREENEMEEAQRLAKIAEIQAFNEKLAKPHLTPTLRLRQVVANRAESEEKEVDLISNKRKELLARERAKREAFEKLKEIGLTKYAEVKAQRSPTYRTQDVFETKFTSFLDQMESGEGARLRARKEACQQLQKEREEVEEANRHLNFNNKRHQPRLSSSKHPKAEASAYGFVCEEEERAYLADNQRRAEQIRAEEAAKKAALKTSADALKAFQKQQADERSRKIREEKKMERLNAQREIEEMAADDARYLEYIRSQIPPDMHPALVEKATRMQ